ncbi:MAG: hypothetical protein AMXMBFR64_38130 [Myxococcales bacterium]
MSRATLLLLLLPAMATAGPLSQGRMSVGLGASGGPRTVSVGAGFGYFVIDQLRPGIALTYTWQGSDVADAHRLFTELSLRYYILDLLSGPVSPFIEANGGVVWLGYRGDRLDEDYVFYTVGGLGGALFMVSRNFGLEAFAGVIAYLGADAVLVEAGVLPEDVDFRWGLGFSVLF